MKLCYIVLFEDQALSDQIDQVDQIEALSPQNKRLSLFFSLGIFIIYMAQKKKTTRQHEVAFISQ